LTVYCKYPDYVGTARVGESRVGVYTDRWERTFAASREYRTFTWRRYKPVAVDATLGYKIPRYEEEDCQGILVLKGGTMPSFAWGTVVLQDAVFFCLDPVGTNAKGETIPDQIQDGYDIYQVDSVARNKDPKAGGSAFDTVQLKKVTLQVEES
jgi:hypothetical protein